jgi:cold shock protein
MNIINYFYYKMKQGTVKFFNNSKGFGFIVDQESGSEFFVHITGLVDKIKDNDSVTFELKDGKKGLNAVNVKLA